MMANAVPRTQRIPGQAAAVNNGTRNFCNCDSHIHGSSAHGIADNQSIRSIITAAVKLMGGKSWVD